MFLTWFGVLVLGNFVYILNSYKISIYRRKKAKLYNKNTHTWLKMQKSARTNLFAKLSQKLQITRRYRYKTYIPKMDHYLKTDSESDRLEIIMEEPELTYLNDNDDLLYN